MVKTNLEAVHEIVRQLRLRDLGGIIVIDFIDMEEKANEQKVLHALIEELKKDRAKTQVLQMSEFGLVQLTRQRVKQSLERIMRQPCPYCAGSGRVKSRILVGNKTDSHAFSFHPAPPAVWCPALRV